MGCATALFWGHLPGAQGRVQRSTIIFEKSISKIFIPNFMFVLKNKRMRFHYVAWVVLQGWDLGLRGVNFFLNMVVWHIKLKGMMSRTGYKLNFHRMVKLVILLTKKLLKQGYRYHKLRKTFSKFYRRYYDLISKFQVGLKSLLRVGLSEPDFYGDLVYKLKKIVGSNNFSAQFVKIISHYKKIGYNINVLQQTACLVVNPITVGNIAFLFNCTPLGRTSDSMMVPT